MNHLPNSALPVHFVGIGGIGMSALARYLLARGYVVTGSDRSPGEQGEALSGLGATIFTGHASWQVGEAGLVVMTSAARADNPEIVEAERRGIPVRKRSELLAAIVNRGRGIAVAGTHGKTTTSALIGHLAGDCGFDPTVLIGGIDLKTGSNARAGSGDLVVAEADEYDASFLHLKPDIAVLTNAEIDHLDFYGTAEHLFAAFRRFSHGVGSLLVTCADDGRLADIVRGTPAQVVTYGIERGDWQAEQVQTHSDSTTFSVRHGRHQQAYLMGLAGIHNVRNALAAIVVLSSLGAPPERIARSLRDFGGVARRFERKGEASGVLVIDDYAHHPTEITANLVALKQRYQRPVRVAFQPHTYSRTKSLLAEFSTAFGEAEAVYITDIYAARETDSLGISGQSLADAVACHHARAAFTGSLESTLTVVARDCRAGDVLVTMGAGDVSLLGPRLLTELARR